MSDSTAPGPEPRDEPDPYLILGHLCSAVVHQVVNAFSAIVSQAEVLKTRAAAGGLPPSEAATRADAIVKAAFDGSILARNLADFSRHATALGAGEAAELVDLDQLVGDRIDDQRRRAGPRTEWIVDLAARTRIPGDASHLRVMFDHLLANARESLPAEGGAIAVSTAIDSAGWLVLEIRDDGSGMSAEVQDHALEPFFSTKPGRPGLGLALARGVWRRHQGAFSIETGPGRGTVIRLSCPPPSSRAQPASPKPDDGAA
jgi:signal transduction histidine kinase